MASPILSGKPHERSEESRSDIPMQRISMYREAVQLQDKIRKSKKIKIPNAAAFGISGDPSESRTPDTMIKSHVLYLLS